MRNAVSVGGVPGPESEPPLQEDIVVAADLEPELCRGP